VNYPLTKERCQLPLDTECIVCYNKIKRKILIIFLNKEKFILFNMKPTINQKRAFNEIVKRIQKGEKVNLGEIMKQVGFTEASAHNPGKNLLGAKGFQKLLDKIDDSKLLDKLNEIALTPGDNRNSISAIKELLTIKNRYPDKTVKVNLFDEQIADLED
jgi:hypothetical protein